MKIIILAAILFSGDAPINSRIFFGNDMAECEKGRKQLESDAKEAGLGVWSRCIEVDRGTKPQVDPKHRDPKSEKRS